MPKLGVSKLVVSAAVASGLALGGLQPAQAAQMQGTDVGGGLTASCDTTVTCGSFRRLCAIPPDNDVDAFVRSASGFTGRPLTASFSQVQGLGNELVVEYWDSGCHLIGSDRLANPKTIVIPGNAAFVAAYLVRPHAKGTFTIAG
jgi:hypothetical protein